MGKSDRGALNFRPFNAGDLAEYQSWFADPDTAARLSYPDAIWEAHVSGKNARCWIVRDSAGSVIGQIQIDQDASGAGHLAFAIAPDRRGQGWGSAMLAAFLLSSHNVYPVLVANIDPANGPSVAMLERCGFVRQAEQDDDGFECYRWMADHVSTWRRPRT